MSVDDWFWTQCFGYTFFYCITAYEDSFLMQNNLCLYQKFYSTKETFVLAGTCRYDNWDYRWIWTNFGQLFNWQTLECMTGDLHARSDYKYYVTINKCDRNNQRQLWECVDESIKHTQSGRYMYYGEHSGYVTTTKYWLYASKSTRFGSKKDVCSQGSQILKLFIKQWINKIPLQAFMTGCLDTIAPNKGVVIIYELVGGGWFWGGVTKFGKLLKEGLCWFLTWRRRDY